VNANFVAIIKRIIAEQGEDILANPQRLKGYVSDYAVRESKVERLVFGRCIEHGAYTELKNAPDAEARLRVKAALAQRVHNNEGLDATLCNDALDVLEAAMFDGSKKKNTRLKNICKSCGKTLQEGWNACPYCLTIVASSQPVLQPSAPVTQAEPAAQASAIPQITPNASTKKKHTERNILIAVTMLTISAILIERRIHPIRSLVSKIKTSYHKNSKSLGIICLG
jgi:hypothetical protein